MNKAKSKVSDKRPNNKKSSRRKRSEEVISKDKSEMVTKKVTNDVSWYLNNPTLTRDAGSLWFSKPAGTIYGSRNGFPGFENISGDSSMSGVNYGSIMTLNSIQTWSAPSGDAGAPLNQVATSLYQYVVHANSRNTSYQKSDLMKLIMAVDGLYQHIAQAIRAYRLHTTFNAQNRLYTSLVKACGWNSSDLRSNVAQLRYYINDAITKVNMLMVPSLFDIFKAHVNSYSNVYMDAESSKANLYVNKPMGYWLYNDTTGILRYQIVKSLQTGGYTVENWNLNFQTMFDAISNSEYMGIMQGDLLKAFGAERMAKFVYLGIDEVLYPIYDPEFLFKLHNTEIPYVRYEDPDEKHTRRSGVFSLSSSLTGNNAAAFQYSDTNNRDGNLVGGFWTPKYDQSTEIALPYWQLYESVSNTGLKQTHLIDMLPGMAADPSTITLACVNKIVLDTIYTQTGSDWEVAGMYNTFFGGYEIFTDFRVLYFTPSYNETSELIESVGNWLPLNQGTDLRHLIPLILHSMWQYRVLPLIRIGTFEDGTNDRVYYSTNFDFWDITDMQEVSKDEVTDVLRTITWSLFSDSTIYINSR